MTSRARISLLAVLIGAIAASNAVIASPAQAGGFGIALWEAGTCNNSTCTYKSVEANPSEAYTQAAGHPPFGLTTFELVSKEKLPSQKEPEGAPLKRVRVDVAQGLASDPEAPQKCSIKAFKEDKCSAAAEVGTNELEVFAKAADVKVSGPVYNLEPNASEEGLGGIPLLFGIHVEIPGVADEHVFLKGYVAWFGDYHEYFEIDNISKESPVLKSKLIFKGTKEGEGAYGNFITLPSECSSTTTNYLEVESWTGEVSRAATHTPVGVEKCNRVPFEPTVEVKPETSAPDQPDGVTTEVKVPEKAGAAEINSADVKDAYVTLPEGLTLNSAAARGLTACTPAQIAIGSTTPVECPASSRIGEVTIEADLPQKSLTGNVYLGGPEGGPITGPPYTIYVDAESPKYGVSVRLKGQVNPNPSTGRLETAFLENPQQPFSEFILKLNGGAQAPLANSLACGSASTEALFAPYTGLAPSLTSSPFTTTGCASPLPFALAQSIADQPANAGAFGSTSYTFNLARADGQQYLSKVVTTLPPGLVGAIPAVALCGEPQAQSGACSSASQIGTATVTVGAGSEPYPLSAPVYLTGPYGGGPFGLSIPVPAVEGPFDLGTVVTRASISVDPHTSRVTVASTLPTIIGGVPVRLKSISVTVNRPGFLYNPTNCLPLATETALASTFGATQVLSTPFAVGGCAALPFSPSFSVSSNADTSKANGASLQVNVTQPPHQANIRSVVTALPVQLPTRLTTLQQACPEATYAADPAACPAGSRVGSASVTTPVLPGTLSGPAYLVSHGGAAFPDLDLLLEGDGVRVILVGNTNIQGGITTSTFASLPDVPVSSFSLSLPAGPYSALTAYGSLCGQPLVMPTTITAQSGAQVKQSTVVAVAGCANQENGNGVVNGKRLFRILKRKIKGHTLLLKIRIYVAGKLAAKGKYLKTASRKLKKAATITLKLPLTRAGLSSIHRHRPLKIRVRVTLTPSKHGERSAWALTTIAFKH